VNKSLEQQILAEIEQRALADDLDRAGRLLGYAKEIGLCVSPPDLFERQLAEDPLADPTYRCRARVKLRAELREEAVVDMTRALLVCEDAQRILLETSWVRLLASIVSVPKWVGSALDAVFHRLDGTKHSEWRHLVRARDASDDVAVHVRMAQLRRDERSDLEACALSSVLERAPGWVEGWLRLIVARAHTGDELGAFRALEQLRARARSLTPRVLTGSLRR
jgi:hypothetical protein